jgi:peptidoglycan/xylan/chitin deacetylase (PgdA/CDA1 family)
MERLADFHLAGPLEVACRRLLLAARLPAMPLGWVGGILNRLTRGRWYSVLARYSFWRGVRRAATAEEWGGLTRGVTILLYHAVTRPGEERSRFVVDRREFAWQMGWLARRGFRVVSLDAYVRNRRAHRLTPGGSVIITFDDGYRDNGEIAAPILRARGFGATIFLVTDCMGDANRWDREGPLAGRRIHSWDEVRALEQAGFAFAPHARSHRDMTRLSKAELLEEVRGAWDVLSREVARPVPVLAYPFGSHNPAVRNSPETVGLLAACTATGGKNTLRTPLNALLRAEIGGATTRLQFRLAVWSGGRRRR